jgi:hypothetical protein
LQRWWRGANLFAALQVTPAFELPVATEIQSEILTALALRQCKNGTFGTPHRVERVAAVLLAMRSCVP